MLIRFVLRDLWRSRGITLFFVINLSLGLLGFVLTESFREAVDRRLSQNSQKLLGADLSISGRRELTEEEKAKVDPILANYSRVSQTELYSMLNLPQTTRLVQVKTLEADFPFYGSFEIEKSTGLVSSRGVDLHEGEVWVYPELRDQLGLSLGQSVQIGERTFVVSGLVKDDVGTLWGGFSLAPRVYIQAKDLQETKLLTQGSLASYYQLFKLPVEVDAIQLAANLSKILDDPGLKIQSHQRAAQQAGRFLQYFADYLGLVAVVSLILASLGLSYLSRVFIQSKLKEFAILLSLGMSRIKSSSFFVAQLCLMGIFAGGVVLLVLLPVFPLLEAWLLRELDMSLVFRYSPRMILMTLGLSTLGLILIIAPDLQRLRWVEPMELFREFSLGVGDSSPSKIWRLPAIALLCVLSIYQSHSLQIGLGFSIGILLIAALVNRGGAFLQWFFGQIKVKGLGLSYTLRSLARGGTGILTVLLATVLGTLILVFMLQVRSSLASEVASPKALELPSLFLFDIQPEQVSSLNTFAQEQGTELQAVSPLVRARLISINDILFEKVDSESSNRFFRSEEREESTRSRSYNLSYRSEPLKSEELVKGTYTSEWSSSDLPPISLEEKFADRMNIQMGDILLFEIEGVSQGGRVASLRRVRWTSFQPNFFIQFPNGVLNEAPQIYLASVPRMSAEKKSRFQLALTRLLPNISVIDVDRTLDKLLSVLGLVGLVLNVMALLAIVSGFFVLISVFTDQLSRRKRDVILLKLLGAPFSKIRTSFLREYRLLTLLGAGLGCTLGVFSAWIFLFYSFDGVWKSDLYSAFAVFLVLMILSEVVTRILVGRVLARTKTSL